MLSPTQPRTQGVKGNGCEFACDHYYSKGCVTRFSTPRVCVLLSVAYCYFCGSFLFILMNSVPCGEAVFTVQYCTVVSTKKCKKLIALSASAGYYI